MTPVPKFDPAGFSAPLAQAVARVDEALDGFLRLDPQSHERARPRALLEAMRYGALASGKRLRPFLTIETARALGRDDEAPVRAGAAIECLHAYSLIHDDLPAMDDDDLRRGRPTVHIVHGEATAILAGDALQALAFEILADPRTEPRADMRIQLCLGLARAAGLAGMVGGQTLDMEAETRPASNVDQVRLVQALKTGALLAFSVTAGALLGGADAATLSALSRYGEALGATFQIADDLLDAEGDAAKLGKRTGKDADRNKATFVQTMGLAGAKVERDRLTAAALDALAEARLGERAARLVQAVLFAAKRAS